MLPSSKAWSLCCAGAFAVLLPVCPAFGGEVDLKAPPYSVVSCPPAEAYCAPEPKAKNRISGAFKADWQGVPISLSHLPSGSLHKLRRDEGGRWELVVFPNIGKHPLLGPHAFYVYVQADGVAPDAGHFPCLTPNGIGDLEGESFSGSGWEISVGKFVNYTYRGPPGSNPNPYTPEVEKILGEVMRGIRIGQCTSKGAMPAHMDGHSPIAYPGAWYLCWQSVMGRTGEGTHEIFWKLFFTEDDFERVVAFYREKGADLSVPPDGRKGPQGVTIKSEGGIAAMNIIPASAEHPACGVEPPASAKALFVIPRVE